MALINASNFGNLQKSSISATQKKPGKFFNVFITGKRRDGQQPGTYQCMTAFDSTDYFINNASEVYFIPLYVKRYWVKYQSAVAQNGERYDKLVAFGWKDNEKKLDNTCKYEYIIAGYLWDSDNNTIVKHKKDLPDNEIQAGDNVLVYFRCRGSKCSAAFTFLNRCNDKAKNLQPLSDNPAFEQSVINPRRFLIKAGISTVETQYGSTDTFDFVPVQNLQDSMVEKLLNQAEKMIKDFDYQFDKSDTIQHSEDEPGDPSVTFSENNDSQTVTPKWEPEQTTTVTTGDVLENIDLGF